MEIQKSQNQDLNSLPEKRIRELPCRINSFDECLNKICFEIGISKMLNPLELDLIFTFLKSEFPLITVSFLDVAFRKFSAGKLNFNERGKTFNNIEHYDKFDNRFLSRIINAYQDYVNNENRSFKPITDESKLIPILEDGKLHLGILIDYYKANGNFNYCIGNWRLVFEYLEKEKLIQYTNEEKTLFANNVYEDLKDEYYKNRSLKITDIDTKLMIENIESIGFENYSISKEKNKLLQNECRKRICILYVENL